MLLVAERDEAERLQKPVGRLGGREHFSHTADCPRLGLERDLNKIAFLQGLAQAQHAACNRDGLQFASGALPICQNYQCRS